ncbi:hypothetical protein [Winogradskyella haliclonae]|uniref:Polysaccharide chain length determinant N-terminal domain-containing protein n=1 Tax=Winogradskyella haliclonae TaxID=2048558 RepID=A0ABQ2BUW6_9FLAO|nr:hypothetical protein [Winogradskyella haliclonae]GGI56276.1 hypothetical protein GCM10011444_05850 [Winogradskyella haliclonae]
MSENTKPTPQNDEVDLGQIFVYIEKVFKKIGELISKLFGFLMYAFGKFLVFLLLIVNVIIKHFIIIGLLGVFGFAIPFFLEKTSKSIYSASMLIKQNYSTGSVLYSNIARYNDLAAMRDSTSLSEELNLTLDKAVNLSEFSITGFRNKNQLLEEYTLYIKDMDSIDKPSFGSYSQNVDLSSSSIQSITVRSYSSDVYEGLSKSIINAINNSPFFLKEREEVIENLKNEIKLTQKTIEKSDSLQDKYFKILDKYYGNSEGSENTKQSTLNLNLANNKDKIDTKEFELFQIQQQNREKLNELQAQLSRKENIIELQKDFASPTLVDGNYKELKLKFPIVFMLLAVLFFVLRNLSIEKYIKEYGSKEKLLE